MNEPEQERYKNKPTADRVAHLREEVERQHIWPWGCP
jgi:hypothetical protein